MQPLFSFTSPWSRRTFGVALALFAMLLLIVGALVDQLILPGLVQSTRTIVMPDIVGVEEDDAKRRLTDLGLQVADVHEQASTEIPAGHVIQQMPYAGATVKEGRRIYLTVSSGQEVVDMPDMVGMSLREAQLTIRRLGLTLGLVTSGYSDSIGSDRIMYQSLQPGSSIQLGGTIDLVVSSGASTISMPDLVGYTVDEARSVLVPLGMTVRSVERVESGALLAGTIVATDPPAMAIVTRDTSVVLRVAGN